MSLVWLVVAAVVIVLLVFAKFLLGIVSIRRLPRR